MLLGVFVHGERSVEAEVQGRHVHADPRVLPSSRWSMPWACFDGLVERVLEAQVLVEGVDEARVEVHLGAEALVAGVCLLELVLKLLSCCAVA